MTRSRTEAGGNTAGVPGRTWRRAAIVLGTILALAGAGLLVRAAEESEAQRRERLAGMSAQEKERLLQKKKRFDTDLSDEQRGRLRKLHKTIASDPNSQALQETLANFSQWLGTLKATERLEVLDPNTDAQKRIARIKELMQQQEEERFRQYVGVLPADDRAALNEWLMEFVCRHKDEVEDNMPREWRSRYRETEEEEARKGILFYTWIWQYRWRHPRVPTPTSEDVEKLIARLSEQTQRQINQAPTPEQREQRARDLVRALALSRFTPPVPRDDLMKFYAELKRDDPRRERLEGLTDDELTRELEKLYHEDRWRQLGGPAIGRWRGPGPSRSPGVSRGGSSPPAFGQPAPPPGPPPGFRDGRGPRDDGRRSEQRPSEGKEQPPAGSKDERPSESGDREPATSPPEESQPTKSEAAEPSDEKAGTP